MRVLIYGREILAQRIKAVLADRDVEVISPSPEDLAELRKGNYDIVMVDALIPQVEEICEMLKDISNASVLVMVNRKQADWNRLLKLETTGYIEDTIGKTELIARLEAVERRYQSFKGGRNVGA